MKIADENWYPHCYLNPTFAEILELAKSNWDTCRILINVDRHELVIASGYGYTHSSAAERYRIAVQKRRTPYCDSFILYRENSIAYLNLEDVGGLQKARFMDYGDSLGEFEETVRDLIRESNLAI
jgi:hypothetical protein